MYKISFTFLFLSLAISSFAAKTYTLTLIVKDQATLQPMPLAQVSIYTSSGKTDLGKTDANGKIEIPELGEKKIVVFVEAQDSRYQTARETFYNSKKENISRVIVMQYTYEEQIKIYDAIDEEYNDPNEPFISDLKDVDTSEFKDAEFIEGRHAMMKFLAINIKYPEVCILEGIQGKVYLEFFIQKDGRITNVKAIRQVHPSIDLEAIRVVRNMPKFSPATLKGEPIKQMFRLPVHFLLQ